MNLKLSIYFMIGMTGLALGTPSSWAMGKAPPAPPVPVASPIPPAAPAAPTVNVIQDSFESATNELEAAEQMLADKKWGDAMLAAKKIVDRVSLMNPKSNYNTSIPVSGILTDDDLTKPFSELLNRKKQALAKAIGDYEGGYYLDLLNLEKRAKLVYLKAFYEKTKDSMLREDIDRLRDELVAIHDISIFVQDSQASDSYLLFDADVANPDQQYFFDRELTQFAVSTKVLKLTEDAFLKLLEKSRESRMKQAGEIPANQDSQMEGTWDMADCMKYTGKNSTLDYDDRKVLCEGEAKGVIEKFVACFVKTNAQMVYYDAYRACADEVLPKQAD